ncbi:MAG TPA: RidA family protein [Nitrososphaera sp.]|nr:RidA family protein [Nitrososphaera sp.]
MIEDKLASLGITLPFPPAPAGSYVPIVISHNLAFVAGQIPTQDGQVRFKGKVGRDVSIEAGQQAARLCTINALAQLKSAPWQPRQGKTHNQGHGLCQLRSFICRPA